MNYSRIYNTIVDRAVSQKRTKGVCTYYERHHIIPRCLGGTNCSSNLVLLTAKEHRIAHACLHLLNPTHPGLALAYIKMRYGNKWQSRDGYIPLKLYNDARIIASEVARVFRKGKTYEEIMGPEPAAIKKKKHAAAMTGRKWTEEQRKNSIKPKPSGFGTKLSNALKGRTFSEETLIKMRLNAKPVQQLDLSGNVVATWPSTRQAAKSLNLVASNITRCCVKQHKKLKGFYWRYVN